MCPLILNRADLPAANRTTGSRCYAVGWSALLSSTASAHLMFLYGTRGCGGEARDITCVTKGSGE